MLAEKTFDNKVCRLCFQGCNDKKNIRIFEEATKKLTRMSTVSLRRSVITSFQKISVVVIQSAWKSRDRFIVSIKFKSQCHHSCQIKWCVRKLTLKSANLYGSLHFGIDFDNGHVWSWNTPYSNRYTTSLDLYLRVLETYISSFYSDTFIERCVIWNTPVSNRVNDTTNE